MKGSEIIENQMNKVGGLQCDSQFDNRARNQNNNFVTFKVALFALLFPKSNGHINDSLLAIPIMAVVVVVAIVVYFKFKFGPKIVAAHQIHWNHGEGILRRRKVVIQGRVVNNHMAVIDIVRLQ